MRRVGAGLRPGPGVVPPARDGAGGGRGRHLGLLPPLDAAHRSRPRQLPDDPALRERRRRQAIAGGYRLPVDHAVAEEDITLVGVGTIMPEVIAAANSLETQGVHAGVVCLTSPDLVFRSFQQRSTRRPGVGGGILDELLPPEHGVPLLTVLDGHPHTLTFLAAARGDRIRCLGVTEFGQSSSLDDAHRLHGIDTDTITDAALTLLGR